MNDQFRETLGAYALGQLDDELHQSVDTHLESCDSCREELAGITPMVRLLPLVDINRIKPRNTLSPVVEGRVFAAMSQERSRQRRRSTIGIASSAVLGIAAALLVAVLLVPSFNSSSTSKGRSIAFANVPAGTQASARLVDQQWGTEIHLEVKGVSGHQTVWFEQPDGTRAAAGSFDATQSESVDLVLSTSFKSAGAVALCVSPPNEPPVLRAPLTT